MKLSGIKQEGKGVENGVAPVPKGVGNGVPVANGAAEGPDGPVATVGVVPVDAVVVIPVAGAVVAAVPLPPGAEVVVGVVVLAVVVTGVLVVVEGVLIVYTKLRRLISTD